MERKFPQIEEDKELARTLQAEEDEEEDDVVVLRTTTTTTINRRNERVVQERGF